MQLFYQPNINNTKALSEEEARHCIKVVRKKQGDIINVIDGNGSFYECRVTEITKKECHFEVVSEKREMGFPFHLHIAIAPTKNMDRLEWFVEKCTEIGISEISFLLCERSERKHIKLERLRKIAVSAAKQSIKATVPQLNDLTKYTDFIKQDLDGTKLIAHLVDEERNYISKDTVSDKYTILIGPEGDFSPKEVKEALSSHFQAISLGPNRLRTETAGISACQQVNILYF
jgi:16S rRNA (uracil1498-N3)-methyltransferase